MLFCLHSRTLIPLSWCRYIFFLKLCVSHVFTIIWETFRFADFILHSNRKQKKQHPLYVKWVLNCANLIFCFTCFAAVVIIGRLSSRFLRNFRWGAENCWNTVIVISSLGASKLQLGLLRYSYSILGNKLLGNYIVLLLY